MYRPATTHGRPFSLAREHHLTMSDPAPGTAVIRSRLSRRGFLQRSAAAAGVLAAASIVGCGDDAASGLSTPLPQRGGTLRFGTSLPIAYGLDPHVEQGAGLAIFPKVYGYLLHVDPGNDAVVYDHASTHEQADATTLILKLKPDARFHDVPPVHGRTVTAADVVASVERFRDNPLVVDKTWHTTVLDRVEALGPQTVRFTLKRPYTYSLNEIGAIGAGAIIPRELVERNENIAIGPVGSGPFRLESIDVTGGAARIVRNDDYFHSPANVDAMQWTVFADDDARITAFRERTVDVIPNRDKNEARALRDLSDQVDVTSEASLSYLSLGLRVDRPPLADPRVRRAIDMLIDRDELIRELAFGEGDILGPVNPRLGDGFWSLPRSEIAAFRGASASSEARIAEAMRLLAAGGASDASLRLQVRELPDLVDVAALLRNQLMRGGIRVQVDALPELEWFVNFRGGQFDATLISHLPHESPDYPTRFYHSKGVDGVANMFGFADPAIDALVERSWAETGEARQATLLEAQRLMLEARPMLQLFTSTGYASAWNYVRNRDRTLIGSMAQYRYRQWLAAGAPGRS
jgi:peptide/nickel transport system substrate-binding protein